LIYEILKEDLAMEILNKNFGFNLKEYKKFITQNPLGQLLEENKCSIKKGFLKKLKSLF
jgi:hypothetical protein